MADGAQQLPTDEELFEHPAVDPQAAEPMETDHIAEVADTQENEEAPLLEQQVQNPEPVMVMEEETSDVPHHFEYQDHHQQYFPEQPEQAIQQPTGPVFQPTAYVAPTFVSQPSDGDAEGSPDNGRQDGNTIWIDSDPDDDTEETILRQNFWLPYSDHNYDCADPADRVVHPPGDPLPIIEGLDEFGNIRESVNGAPVEPTSPSRIHLHAQPVRRPVNSTAPFSIGGNQVEYIPQRHSIRDPPQVRYEYGNSPAAQRLTAPGQRPQATNILGTRGGFQQQGAVRATSLLPPRRVPQPAGAAAYMPQPGSQPRRGVSGPQRPMGALRQAAVRPVQHTRPLSDMNEREFTEQAPLPTPHVRRPPEMAPHRMTLEQRNELARGRSVAQFPNERSPIRGAQNRLVVRGHSVANPLLRSPQRMEPLHPTLETSPRKFQVKVTDSYSAPIQKINELPAQLTEDPPEETNEPEVAQSGSPIRSSPTKHADKPTPPHRLTHDEKTAHLAKIKDKDPGIVQQPPAQLTHVAHAPIIPEPIIMPPVPAVQAQVPVPVRHPQDDALAVVQSVFDSSKPRAPDTPKDKEAILKIAAGLRMTAEQYEKIPSASSVGTDSSRRRHDSGMSHGAPHGPPHPPYHPPDKRYELGSHRAMQQNPNHQNISPVIPLRNNQMEPPHRPRGRPRGSTVGAQKNRVPEPIAPHRVGGARTLPPRAQQQQPPPPPRNGAVQQDNSDSESEGVDEDWEMRCHCGLTHSTGATIECEKCKAWQHTFCMGLDDGDNTDGYMCEICNPRKLGVSKAEAIRIQKIEIKKVKKATEEEARKKGRNKRRSEPVADTKKTGQANSRKSAPMSFEVKRAVPQMNEYSKAAAALLGTIQMTAGADTLLEESATTKRAKRMYVSENVQALVTTMMVNQRAVVLEVNGYVSMVNEVKRQPGGGSYIFMYDGLMKGTTGEDMGDGHELVCVDTRRKGNDSKFTRRSCEPNCVLKHVLGSRSTLGVMIVATKDIPYNQEVTLPFDMDWSMADQPLECADHVHNIDACPFEVQRRLCAATRAAERKLQQDAIKAKLEAEKRDKEERKRLEDEVRRERKAAQEKMDEEEREQERLEEEKKKEELRQKRKEEKEKRKSVERSRTQSLEPTSSTREQRRVQHAEEMFRRIEEEKKKKEEQQARKSSSDAGESSARRSSARKAGFLTPKNEVKEEIDIPGASDGRRVSRRLESINSTASDRTVSPPAKRPRSQTVQAPKPVASAKRNAPRLSTAPSAKRSKKEALKKPKQEVEDEAELTIKKLRDTLYQNSLDVISGIPRTPYEIPASIQSDPVSEWATKMVQPNYAEDDKSLVKEKKEKKDKKQRMAAEAKATKAKNAPKEVKEEPVDDVKTEPVPEPEPVQQTVSEVAEKKIKQEPEESVKSPSPKKVKAPKKLSLSEYKQRKAATSEAATPTTSGAPAARRGFIPSTEGSNTANVQLSTIPLDEHIKPSSTAAPPAPEVDDSVEDEPAAHKQSLADRIAGLMGNAAPSSAPASSANNTPTTRTTRRSRWGQ